MQGSEFIHHNTSMILWFMGCPYWAIVFIIVLFWIVIKILSTVSDDCVAPIFLSTWKTTIGNPIFYLNPNSY